MHQRPPHSAPYKPHGVRTQKTFFGSKSKKTKSFVIFDPKNGDQFFSPTSNLPRHLKKVGFKWGWGLGGGGSGPKTHWGMCLLDKIMILQGVKPTIQPCGVGYANRPKKAPKWG